MEDIPTVLRFHGPRRHLGIISAIIAVAVALSLIAYQYSLYFATQIEEISVRNTRSNAEVQVTDLRNSLANKLGDITSLLQVMGASRSVHDGDLTRATSIFNNAQLATSDLVELYMWLDGDGKIVWISNLNQTTYEQYRGFDLSYRLYFTEPRATHSVYYSSIVDSNDGINRLYIAYPILVNATGLADSASEFKGVVVAGVRTDVLGKFLESQISPKLTGEVGLIDHGGLILYSKDTEYSGLNVFGLRFQTFLQTFGSDTSRVMANGFKLGLQGHEGSEDIEAGARSAFVYTPILLEGKQFGLLYIVAPYAEAAETTALVENQKNISVMLIAAISASAVIVMVVILRQNKSLEKTIAQRTAQLREANEQLTVHDRLQREFINIAAHELRTPVQPILGMSEILESEMGERSEDIRLIARNAKRLERLTQDILDASKIESGSLTFDKQKIDLDEVISAVVVDYANRPDQVGVAEGRAREKVKIRYEPKRVIVEADSSRIQQVISNLISNALKFTKEGEVVVKTDIVDGHVKVTVKDTGSGIDSEIRPRLFQKFATKSDKGTGLGLYISNSIVRAHGGRMWAENNEDEGGATFCFTLPLKPDEDQAH